jgi:hypothetical protein
VQGAVVQRNGGSSCTRHIVSLLVFNHGESLLWHSLKCTFGSIRRLGLANRISWLGDKLFATGSAENGRGAGLIDRNAFFEAI